MRHHPLPWALILLASAVFTDALAQCIVEEDLLLRPFDDGFDRNRLYGHSVDLRGGVLAVGSPESGPGTGNAGSVYVYDFQRMVGGRESAAAGIPEVQKIHAANARPSMQFGWSVAVRSDLVVVGAPWLARRRGAVYVFGLEIGQWRERQQLLPSIARTEDLFGEVVSLSRDRIAVGAPQGIGSSLEGRVFIFRHNGSSWVEEAILRGSNSGAGDRFGRSLELSNDTLIVGTRGHGTFIFRFDGSQWVQEQHIFLFGGLRGAVALQHNLALIGYADYTDGPIQVSGTAFVFRRSASHWTQVQQLWASDRQPWDLLGWTVDMRDDVILLGAFDDDGSDLPIIDPTCNSGAGYIFRKVGSQWVEERKLVASDATCRDRLGVFALATDGTWASFGSMTTRGSAFGGVYLADVSTGPDPLFLHANRASASAGDDLRFSGCRGSAGSPAMLWITALNFQSTFLPIAPAGTFNAHGQWEVSGTLSASPGVLPVEFRLFGLSNQGAIVSSNAIGISFQ